MSDSQRKWDRVRRVGAVAVVASVCLAVTAAHAQGTAGAAMTAGAVATPKVGEKARDFSLMATDGGSVRLSEETTQGPVVLVVLRGWPGYQCPFCTRQFGEFVSKASDITAKGAAKVLFVYPGPAEGLKEHAQALTANRELPRSFRILIDPDYTFTNAYGLRWNAPQETAYPSTFVIDASGTVRFAQTSREHGGRVPVADVLKALAAIQPMR